MNPDRAFEQHTDLVRALTRPGSPERAWWDRKARRKATTTSVAGHPGNYTALGDYALAAGKAAKREPLETSLILSMIPTPPNPEITPGDDWVGVVDPERLRGAITDDPGDTDAPEQIAMPVEVLAEWSARQIAHAPTVYVTEDMVTLLEHAAHALDDTDLMPFHPAYRTGVAVFARPLRLPYGDGTDQIVNALAWTDLGRVRTAFGTTGHAGYLYEFANRHHLPRDREVAKAAGTYPSKQAWAQAPDLVLNVAEYFVTGTSVGSPVETFAQAEQRRVALLHQMETGDSGTARAEPPNGRDDSTLMGRGQPYLAALLLLLSQDITVTRTERAHDYAVRRATRSGRQRHDVTVVDVRRRPPSGEPGEHGEPGERTLHERHIVGGHWKWQPYGEQRRLRKRIFVAAYVRGPEDAPLVAKPRVHRL